MNDGLFYSQLNEIEKILKRFNLFNERNHFPDYTYCVPNRFRKKSYREIWEICYSEKYFDYFLSDQSIIQFQVDNSEPSLRYAFYEAPFSYMSYTDFLIKECGFLEQDLTGIGDSLRDEYDDAYVTSSLKEIVTPIRYDFDPLRYIEGRHPASHIHFGFSNNIRVGTIKLLRPLSFLVFIFRQCYPDIWINFLNTDENINLCKNVRENLDDINDSYRNPLDSLEMSLL